MLLASTGTSAIARVLTLRLIDSFAGKPRIDVLSDIGNRPNDRGFNLQWRSRTKGARVHDWAYCELADLDAGEYDETRSGI